MDNQTVEQTSKKTSDDIKVTSSPMLPMRKRLRVDEDPDANAVPNEEPERKNVKIENFKDDEIPPQMEVAESNERFASPNAEIPPLEAVTQVASVVLVAPVAPVAPVALVAPVAPIALVAPAAPIVSPAEELKEIKRPLMTKAREVRLEQNRKAARESRRRKKVMIEELQRSVIFFSRANGTLKQQNDELTRMLMQAQAQVTATENGQKQAEQNESSQTVPAPATNTQDSTSKTEGVKQQQGAAFQQAQAQAVATQAMYESQGFPAAAARAAAQTMNASVGTPAGSALNENLNQQATNQHKLPPMQPGATMQAMANFQQAAAAAMQAAVQGMQAIPGVNMNSLAATPMDTNPQQAYTDTMTALAMQQAAAAAAGQQFTVFQPGSHFMTHPMVTWQNSPAPANSAAPVTINADKNNAQPQSQATV